MTLLDKIKTLLTPNQDNTENMIDELKAFDWFIQIYSNSRYRFLIQHDESVRSYIVKNYSKKQFVDEMRQSHFQTELIEILLSRS